MTALKRLINFIGFNDGVVFAGVLAIVLWSLALAGCSTGDANMPDLYIIAATYATFKAPSNIAEAGYMSALRNLTRDAHLEVRAGFFGVCTRQVDMIATQRSWTCGSATSIQNTFASQDPLRLVTYLDTLSQRVAFYGLYIGAMALLAIAIIIVASFPRWRTEEGSDGEEEEIKPFPSRPLLQIAAFLSICAAIFGMTSMLWTHIAAIAFAESLDQLLGPLVETSLGIVFISIGWVAVGLVSLVAISLVVVHMSIQLLAVLTDED